MTLVCSDLLSWDPDKDAAACHPVAVVSRPSRFVGSHSLCLPLRKKRSFLYLFPDCEARWSVLSVGSLLGLPACPLFLGGNFPHFSARTGIDLSFSPLPSGDLLMLFFLDAPLPTLANCLLSQRVDSAYARGF